MTRLTRFITRILWVVVRTGSFVISGGFAPVRAERSHGYERDRYYSPHRDRDIRYRHDHFSPARGYVVPALPPGYVDLTFGGQHFSCGSGACFRRRGPRFVVVQPPVGIWLGILPPSYSTLWIGGTPYYSANGIYDTVVPNTSEYVVITPRPRYETAMPLAAPAQVPAPPPPTPVSPQAPPIEVPPDSLFVYPSNEQTQSEIVTDRSECDQWAIGQAGDDPAHPGMGSAQRVGGFSAGCQNLSRRQWLHGQLIGNRRRSEAEILESPSSQMLRWATEGSPRLSKGVNGMIALVALRLLVLFYFSFSIMGCVDTPRSRPPHEASPSVPPSIKETKSLGTSWENEFGLVQGAKAGGVVFLSGQLGLDEKGMVVGKGSMEAQMRQAYANVAKVLQQFNLTMNDVLEETIYVTDMPQALTTGPKIRKEVYSEHPAVSSTLVQVQRLAFADALVEIRIVAKAPAVEPSRPSTSQSDDTPRHRGGRGRSGGLGGSSPF